MRKTNKQITGDAGENLAREFLQEKGFTFLEANWSCKLGEIDLIMNEDDTRVFVEVRTRKPTSYGEGLDTVAHQKQRKLIRAAEYYQQTHDYWGNARFDVVSITAHPDGRADIEHIPDAFMMN